MASNLFGMMNTSTTGLMSSQVAISTTSNNITNANTVGYTRQRTLITNNGPIYYRGTGYLGTGVHIKDIQRIRDAHLDAQIRKETTTLKEYEAKQEVLEEVEVIFNEPSDSGLNAMMSKFWTSWEELSKHPENSTMHKLVKENTQAVTDQLHHLNTLLNDAIGNVQVRQEHQAGVVESLINQLNVVNGAIQDAYEQDPSKTPNELLDQRDLLTKQLAEALPVTVKEHANGTVSVSTTLNDGTTLDVLGMDKQAILDEAANFTSGMIKGYEDAKNDLQNDFQSRLNNYAEVLANGVNQAQGFNFFQFDPANPAGTIEINPGLLNGTLTIQTGTNGTGDNSIVNATLAVRSERFTLNGEETTLDDYYATLIADVGTKTQQAQTMVKTQGILVGYLDDQYESVSGVSLDEEIVNLVQYQKAYDANAKVISTITEMLDTIINRLGA